MAEVSVIIVNYNAGKYLPRCLEALLKQDYTDFEVIIVDNASTDGSLEAIPSDPRISVFPLDQNWGFAKGNNRGSYQAKGKWLALLNPDAFPEPNWLSSLMKATRDYPEFGMFGSTQISADNPSVLDGTGDIYHIAGIPQRGNYGHPVSDLPETGEVFGPCAAAALYRKDVFDAVGGFDEAFFCYCEDVDLAFRLRLRGVRCLQVKEAVVYHVGSATTNATSDFVLFHGIRNAFWVFIKNMPMAFLIPLLPLQLAFQACYILRAIQRKQGFVALRAFREALAGTDERIKDRSKIQKSRTISLRELWKSFTVSFDVIRHRKGDVRVVKR